MQIQKWLQSIMVQNLNCPCASGKTYLDCCGVFITHQKLPSTPKELMRSRYTAYYQVNTDYIARTMKSPAADHFDVKAAREWAKKIKLVMLISFGLPLLRESSSNYFKR